MKSKILKACALLISAGSVLPGVYWLWQFAQAAGPDRSLFLAPIFFFGFPSTILGNVAGFAFMTSGRGLWYSAIPIFICYLLQWQLISLWLYRKGSHAASTR